MHDDILNTQILWHILINFKYFIKLIYDWNNIVIIDNYLNMIIL